MKVNSSAISDIDYDADTQALTVVFHNGGRYRYDNVPLHIYDQLIGSTSIGRTFQQLVCSSQSPSTKLP